MSIIKHRNGMELTEAEAIQKQWLEYTEIYKKKKKIIMTQIITMA